LEKPFLFEKGEKLKINKYNKYHKNKNKNKNKNKDCNSFFQ